LNHRLLLQEETLDLSSTMSISSRYHCNKAHQRGVTLLVSLLFLMAISVGVVSGMGHSVMNDRIALNHKERSLAHQAAESAVNQAEVFLQNTIVPDERFSENADGFYERDSEFRPDWAATIPTNGRGFVPLAGSEWDQLHQPPGYYIEYLEGIVTPGSGTGAGSSAPNDKFYRITAFGDGFGESSRVVLRVVFRKIAT